MKIKLKANSILGYSIIILTVILIVWISNHQEWFDSIFLQNSIIGLIYLIGLLTAGSCIVEPQVAIPKNEKQLWIDIRKQSKTRFLLTEIFKFDYYWLIIFGLVGLLLMRDYFRDGNFIDNLGLYMPLPLIVLFVHYKSAAELWKESEKFMKSSY